MNDLLVESHDPSWKNFSFILFYNPELSANERFLLHINKRRKGNLARVILIGCYCLWRN